MARHLKKGQQGEDIALDFLIKKGYEIVVTNYKPRRAEIDIIAQDGGTLVFVEVKTRKNDLHPETAVTFSKQKLIVSVASQYIESVHYEGNIRFDIIAITHKHDQDFTIQHYVDAFFPGIGF